MLDMRRRSPALLRPARAGPTTDASFIMRDRNILVFREN